MTCTPRATADAEKATVHVSDLKAKSKAKGKKKSSCGDGPPAASGTDLRSQYRHMASLSVISSLRYRRVRHDSGKAGTPQN
jgi:hypothetical protein